MPDEVIEKPVEAPVLPPGIKLNEAGQYVVEVTIDGVKHDKPFEQVLTDASKVGGADERFREAAKLREQAALGTEALELHKKLQSGSASDDEKNRYCDIYETSDEYRQTLLYGQTQEQDDNQMVEQKESKPLSEQDLPASVRARLDKIDKLEESEARKQVLQEVGQEIDNSQIYDKLKNEVEPSQVAAFRKVVDGMVKAELVVRLDANQPYSPKLRAEVVKEILTRIQNLKDFQAKREQPAPMGFGGSAAGLGASIVDDKAPERVAGSDPDFIANSKQRIKRYLLGKK